MRSQRGIRFLPSRSTKSRVAITRLASHRTSRQVPIWLHLSVCSTVARYWQHVFCHRSHPYPFWKEIGYAGPGLHLVRIDSDLDSSSGKEVMARMGRCSGKQRHHLLHWDAHGAVRFRTGEPLLHGPLRK